MSWRRAVGLMVLMACGQGADESLNVWLGPCDAWQPAGACLARASRVVLWAEAERAPVLHVDGKPVELAFEPVDGGWRGELAVEEAAELHMSEGGRSWTARVVSDLGEQEPGRPGLDDSRVRRAAGDWVGTIDALTVAENAYAEAGWSRDAEMSRWRRVEAEIRLLGVGEVGEDPVEDASVDPTLTYTRRFVRGRSALAAGDLRRGLLHYRRAAQVASRALPDSWTWTARVEIACALAEAGRVDAALEEVRQVLSDAKTDACDAVWLRNNTAWAFLQVAERDAGLRQEALSSAEALLAEAQAAVDRDPSCGGPGIRTYLNIHQAFAGALAGDEERVTRHLARVPEDAGTDELMGWRLLLSAEQAARRGDPASALADWQDLEAHARRGGAVAFEWRALDGQAAAHVALGDVDAALARWRSSEVLFGQHGALVPLQDGRAAFLERRVEAVRQQVDVLLAQGRPVDAFRAARRFRSQYIASVNVSRRVQSLDSEVGSAWRAAARGHARLRDERDEIVRQLDQLPRSEREVLEERLDQIRRETQAVVDTGFTALALPTTTDFREPRAGEVMVVWVPRGDGSWTLIARSTDGVQHAVVRSEAWWPSDVDALLGGATQITLLTGGDLDPVDLHRALWRGRPLYEQVKVAWSIDAGGDAPYAMARRERALVVVDPSGNLRGARDEGREVTRWLRAEGLDVTAIERGDATRAAILAALSEGVDLLHYAGHGEASDEPLSARLRLGHRSDITLPDVLALSKAPRLVVLAGCETAKTADRSVATLGLAQAFVHAGSEAVVASVRPVDDGLAAAFSLAFHASAARHSDVRDAFNEALRTISRELPSADWGALRLVIR